MKTITHCFHFPIENILGFLMSWKIVFVSAKYNRNQRLSSKFLWNLNQLEDTLKTLDSQRGGKSEKWLIGLGLILLSSWSIGSQPPPPTSRINQWTNQHPLSITILNQSRPLFLIYISPKNRFHSSFPHNNLWHSRSCRSKENPFFDLDSFSLL